MIARGGVGGDVIGDRPGVSAGKNSTDDVGYLQRRGLRRKCLHLNDRAVASLLCTWWVQVLYGLRSFKHSSALWLMKCDQCVDANETFVAGFKIY